MGVRYARAAEQDLEAIGDYIASDNPLRAITFIDKIQERCESLMDFPRRFPLLPNFEHLGIRKFSHGSYLILYRIEDEVVTIIHVVHSATDYQNMLEF